MRIVVADCSVDYEGRLTAHLPVATRLVMVKADGCVAIHADGGAYKPLNWMNAPNHHTEEEGRWVVTNPKGEKLTINFEDIHFETAIDLRQGDLPVQRQQATGQLDALDDAQLDRPGIQVNFHPI